MPVNTKGLNHREQALQVVAVNMGCSFINRNLMQTCTGDLVSLQYSNYKFDP